MQHENKYATFDARIVQELEERNEFDLCSTQCLIGIGEIVGGAALAIFGGGPGAAGGAAIIIEGGNDVAGPGGC